MDLLKQSRTNTVKRIAKDLGFDFCGIAKAEFLEEEARDFETWLKKGFHGDMGFMERSFDMRTDPRRLVPGAKSVVSLLINYSPQESQSPDSRYKITKYAYGRDYHNVIKKQLKQFVKALHSEIGEVGGRAFVDSAPVMEKSWAKRAGLGWLGKHSNLINKEKGSFFFIAQLILDLDLEVDGPVQDYCGSCTKCIDACPTDALIEPYKIDGTRCISYLTIELKEKIPEEFKGKMENWVFGCDICQDVCPWNRFQKPHKNPGLEANPHIMAMSTKDWEELTEEVFEKLFYGSPIKRTQYHGLKRNIGFTKI